jgi:hypothetical protein
MAKPYSQDLRGRLVLAVLSGQSRRNVARSFDPAFAGLLINL